MAFNGANGCEDILTGYIVFFSCLIWVKGRERLALDLGSSKCARGLSARGFCNTGRLCLC